MRARVLGGTSLARSLEVDKCILPREFHPGLVVDGVVARQLPSASSSLHSRTASSNAFRSSRSNDKFRLTGTYAVPSRSSRPRC
jgi:hypothetical protein